MSGNAERGEFSIELEGVTYGHRPSFAAIQAMEAATGLSLRVIASEVNALTMSIEMTGVVAAAMMRAWGASDPDAPNASVARAVKDARVAELIYEQGVVGVSARLTVALVAALTGGVTASGEAKAKAATGTPTDA